MTTETPFERMQLVPKKTPKLDGVTSWLKDDLAEFDSSLDDAQSGKSKTVSYSTGLPSLDAIIGGFQQGQYYVIAGQTGFGKSSFALTTSLTLSSTGEPSPLFVSLEMSRRDMAIRAIAWLTGIPQFVLMQAASGRHALDDAQRQAISTAKDLISKDIRLMSSGMLTPQDVRREAESMQATAGLSIVVVDYLQLVRGTQSKNGTREQEVGEVSRALRAISLDLNVPVIALSQLSRKANGKDQPDLSDLRESGSLEQDASAVLFLAQIKDKATGKPIPEVAKVIVAKNRFGGKAETPVGFLGDVGMFVDGEVQCD